MASTKQLILTASSMSLASAAVAQARDPNRFPWSDAAIARVGAGNKFIERALSAEAALTKPNRKAAQMVADLLEQVRAPKPKAKSKVKKTTRKAVSAWLQQQLADAAELVEQLDGFDTHKVTIEAEGETLKGWTVTLGEPEVGKRGGVSVNALLKKGKATRSYELSGKQALKLFEGGNCGTPAGHVLYSA